MENDQNVILFKGQTQKIVFTLRDEDGNLYTNFTGMTFEWELAETPNTTPVITRADAAITKDAANSQVSLELTNTETAALTTGSNKYWHELHVFTDGGTKEYIATTGNVSARDSLLD